MYTKEELYPIIKKIWETSDHPNVKDDFETVWGIREKYFPFKENEFGSGFKYTLFNSIELRHISNKKELMEKLEDVPEGANFHFGADYDNEPILDIYINEPITIEMVAHRLYNTLHSWACISAYAMYKRMNTLEKENEELKEKLKDK